MSISKEASSGQENDEFKVALHAVGKEIKKEREAITRWQRRRKIVSVFAKHGLLFLLKDTEIWKLFGKKQRNKTENDQLHKIGERIRIAFEELGSTFIKLGQVLVTRQDLLPEPITLELEKLLDEVPAIDFRHIQYVLEAELEDGLDTFEWIHPIPLGSGSLAQVYKAGLKDRSIVAVKVIRPTVEKLFQTDIAVIKQMAKMLQKRLPVQLSASLNLMGLVEDYYSGSMEELDMQIEAFKMNEYRREVVRFEHIHVPEVVDATKNVLLMEYINGWMLKEFPVDYLSFEERVLIMTDLAHGYIESMLVGIYHADAHGSNIMIDKNEKRAVVIDWGMTGKIDSNMAHILMRTIMHIQLNQADDAAEVVIELFPPTVYTDIVKLRDELSRLALHYVNTNQGNERYNYGRLVLDAMTIAMKNYCKIPSSLALWAKGFSATEGVARWLCPEISYGKMIETYEMGVLKNMLGKRFNYRANASLLGESGKLLATFPRRINKVMEHTAGNNMKMNLQVQTDPISSNLANQVINRIGITLIFASILIVTSMMIANASSARFLGIEAKTYAGFGIIASTLFTIFVLWRLLRSGKHRSIN
ncbi:ABC1 kinase family protein [Pueribacillus theae]|uniref:ABC1 kinase family protein n=1 Tax=Pueribacillus theae TaxID=2171751 RepID=UPI001F0BE5EC|nr:AarF/UbiB family protein [Pueribacillus theae]